MKYDSSALNVGAKLCGFTVIGKRSVLSENGILFEFVHDKTGARLLWLCRDELNKTFAIAFKTPPRDDTGIFHIIEHSVLSGSEKYPLKEPFLDLLKGSLQTFLNAFTFPDKTMYPVSSRNDKDFMNLVRVYLDGVFRPAIYTNPLIFMQEGWRYEYDENGELDVNGVVYSEMQGDLSGVDSLINMHMNRLLYPDTCYSSVFGGLPSTIPTLTYEQFIENHARYYNPSNSYTFLDGDLELDSLLDYIDSEYFSKYEKEENLPQISLQKEVKPGGISVPYAVTEDEDGPKGYYSLGRIIGTADEKEKIAGTEILCQYLSETNESPVKKAIIDSGLALDFEMYVNTDLLQPAVIMTAQNMRTGDGDEIIATIVNALDDVFENGINHEELLAIINRRSFNSAERSEPYGLRLAVNVMNSWLYGLDPLSELDLRPLFERLRALADTSFYEDLLRELFGDINAFCALEMVPDTSLSQKQSEERAEKLRKINDEMTEDERQRVISEREKLDKWQSEPDSDEKKALMPSLELSDIPKKMQLTEYTVLKENGVSVVATDCGTNSIAYTDFFFTLRDMNVDELHELALMTELLAELDTKKHTSLELARLLKLYLGSFEAGMAVLPLKDGEACAFFTARAGALYKNSKSIAPLVCEILRETVFTDRKKVKDIIAQCEHTLYQGIIASGHAIAARRVGASSSSLGAIREEIDGYSYYLYIKGLSGASDDEIDALCDRLCSLAERVFTRERLIAGIAGDGALDAARELIDALPEGEKPGAAVIIPKRHVANEKLLIPAGISYAGKGGSLASLTDKFTGEMSVFSQLITYDYLWNEVRVKGGAYGTGLQINDSLDVTAYSFRDPNGARTLEIYDKIYDYVKEWSASGEPKTVIIGALSAVDPLLSPKSKCSRSLTKVIKGTDNSDTERIYSQILETTSARLVEIGEMVRDALAAGASCVVGSREILDSLGDGYDLISNS